MRIDWLSRHPHSPFQHFMEAAMRLSAMYGDSFRDHCRTSHAVNLAWEARFTGKRSLLREAWIALEDSVLLHRLIEKGRDRNLEAVGCCCCDRDVHQ